MACSLALLLAAVLPLGAAVNVTQHHNHATRDGLFVDPAYTQTAAAAVTRDTNFNGAISGNVYAQPLYVEGGPGGRALVIAVTESNNVYALDAITGGIIWQRNVGTAIAQAALPCGNINPVGITSTPAVDLPSRALFLDAEVSGNGHQIFSLNVDTGAINSGYPVTLNTAVAGFNSFPQSNRAAPAIIGDKVYFPYGGRFGDCNATDGTPYRGRLVAIMMSSGAVAGSYATSATRSGVWGPGGVASDGTNAYITTGNGPGGTTWAGSEAVIRLQPGAVFSGATTDYWAPSNWAALDSGDTDLGGSGPILVDVPGATPSSLVVALGKDGNAYLLNRTTLGGVSAPLASSHVGSGSIIQAGATYRTGQATYVVFRANSTTLTAFKINAANPPTISSAWTVSQSGSGSPFVTSTDGTNNVTVWVVGAGGGGDQRLHGYDGDSGTVIYAGGGTNELMTGTRRFNTGIAARNRIYVANDNRVYAFVLPAPALQVASAVSRKTHGGAGTFDVPLPLTGTSGVECRAGDASNGHTLVFTFSNEIVSGNASVTAGTGIVAGSPTFSGNTMTVNLTGVDNAQTVTLNLSGVTDGYSQVLPTTALNVSFLLGDTNGDRVVNAGDALQTRNRAGQATDATNFRSDVNTDGLVNSGDTTVVRARSGTFVTAPSP
ncbi:MAG: dockerin type I domain-containing protein, partial [Verrucomicrobiota bacterium]|nr:dockerin type I domain-containing protein [Verrucomicrobiota bacterium]